MTIPFWMAIASVAACLVTLSRVVGWAVILKYATIVDVVFTFVLAAFFAGTLTGSLVAVLGGLLMALVLTAIKYITRVSVVFQPDQDSEYNENGWIYNQKPYV